MTQAVCWFRAVLIPAALVIGGCSGNTSSPTAPAASAPPQGQVSAVPPASTPPAQVPPAVVPNQPAAAAPAANSVADMVAQIKDLQSKRPQRPSRQELPKIMQDQDTIINLSEKVLAADPQPADRDHARMAALESITLVSQLNPKRRELLEKVDKLAESALADISEGPQLASVYFFRAFTHLNIERDGSESDPGINQRLFAMAKEFAEKFAGEQRAGFLLYQIGENAQMDGQNDTAMDVLRFLSEHDQGRFGQMAAGKLKLLEAVGKPPEIAGPTLEGSEIDIAQFKGKVVLVDFWATWCGPCVAELPNVRAVYDKYHDQGFEVLAVSFDQTKDALTKFVEQNKLPWPQIFFDEEGKRYWQNPLGQKYGINAIPATFLVDRQGNLQKIGVRGPNLEPAVVELLKAKSPEAN